MLNEWANDGTLFTIWWIGWAVLAVLLPFLIAWVAKPHDDLLELVLNSQLAAFCWMLIAFIMVVVGFGLSLYAPVWLYTKGLEKLVDWRNDPSRIKE